MFSLRKRILYYLLMIVYFRKMKLGMDIYLQGRTRNLGSLWVICFLSIVVGAQELPPVVNYPTEDYSAANQNWAISQDQNNAIYVANNDGLLEFNGARWTLYPSPNKTIIRSVKVIDDRIYTGSYMDFGYWLRDSMGRLLYTSLSEKLNLQLKEDEQFWKIIDYGSWVVFQSLDTIYSYHTETGLLSIISSENTIHKTFVLEDTLYLQVNKEGLYKMENGEQILVSDDPIFKRDVVVAAFFHQNEMLFVTSSNGFYRIDNERVLPWNTNFTKEKKFTTIYSCIPLRDGTLMLGTVADGVFQLSEYGDVLLHFNKYNGLNDNTVLSLFQDANENVWLGLDNGIDCINLKTPFKNYIDQLGVLGTVYASIIHNEYLYLGTNQGLFHRSLKEEDRFSLVMGTNGQVWSLDQIDGTLFCGHNSGTFIVNKGEATLVASEMGTWGVKKIPDQPNLLLQGNYNGLFVLAKNIESNEWTIRNKVEGFEISSRYFEFSGKQTILISHEYKGVYMVNVDPTFHNTTSLTARTEIDKAANSSLVSYDNTVYYGNDTGIYKFQDNTRGFIKDSLLSTIFTNDKYSSGKLIAKEKFLWAFTENYIHFVKKDKLNNDFTLNQVPIPLKLRKEMKGFENVTPLDGSQFLLGTSNGYLLIDLNTQFQNDYQLKIDAVKMGEAAEQLSFVPLDTLLTVRSKENYFAFQYSVPEFEKYMVSQFSFKLEGDENLDAWSPWSPNNTIRFTKLSPGEYTFYVKAKVNNFELPKQENFSFKIATPWYASYLAIAFYFVGFIIVIFFVNALYTRYYKKEQDRLLDKTKREGKLRELESQQEIIQLKNESLHQDIEARNRELAIATMSMVKGKNQLNSIKDALMSIDGSSKELAPIIQLVNENLESKDDWKFFEEAFNHADKDFFKRIKALHPNLTPNDLRLCVYLRLNLSSKEIAPLLNISPRSVEIKRYRLRKKIELDTSINLNDYFIKI